jgi:hypothetical protein
MKGMAGPRIAIDAAMLAPAIGIDRLVERNIGRRIAREYRPWPFNRHRCPQGRHIAIQPFAFIQPFPLNHPFLQIKAGGRPVYRRTSALGEIGVAGFGHWQSVACCGEQI